MVLFYSYCLPFHLQLPFKSLILFTEVFASWFWLPEWPSCILWYTIVDGVSWVTWSLFCSTDWTGGSMLSVKNTWLYSSFPKFDLTESALALIWMRKPVSLLPTLEDHADGRGLFGIYFCHWRKVNYCAVHWYNNLGQHDNQNRYWFQTCWHPAMVFLWVQSEPKKSNPDPSGFGHVCRQGLKQEKR